MSNCINSSKVYCKFLTAFTGLSNFNVLIVAKCIVNSNWLKINKSKTNSINSSKVYCKSLMYLIKNHNLSVLIVAKCIVNSIIFNIMIYKTIVLIVAKCIVNLLTSSATL